MLQIHVKEELSLDIPMKSSKEKLPNLRKKILMNLSPSG